MKRFRWRPLASSMAAAALTGVCHSAEMEEKPVRTKPEYRVLFNQDCTDFFDKGRHTQEAVQRMVDEVADGGADVFLVNPNAQFTNYPSKAWQTFWEGYKEDDRSWFGNVPDESVPRRQHWIEQMAKLAEECDYLATALARCREKGITPGISLRMNDMHDAPWPTSHMFSRFWKENPQFRLKPWPGRGWGATGLDYAHPEVREYNLSLIRELADGYDFDVLELDFLRFPYYFSRENVDQHCETMTGFIRKVRAILDGTGRPIALIPRVASRPGAAQQLGFDVQAWARERLIDGITAADFLTAVWNIPIAEFRSLVGPEVPVYAGMEVSVDRRDGLPGRHIPDTREMIRGFAAGYLAAGADGINTFNYFLARNHPPARTAAEFFAGLREMRSLAEARGKARIHVITASHWLGECDMPEQVPVTLRAGRERRFEMLLAAEVDGLKVEASICFEGEPEAEDLWLRIGLHSVGRAVEIREGPERKQGDSVSKTKIAVFNVPAGVIKDGRNELVIRSDKVDTMVLGIDVVHEGT